MAGHTSRHRMHGVAHPDALLLELVGHLTHGVLRLRHRHAVTGHDDDRTRVLHDERGVVGAARLDGFIAQPGSGAGIGIAAKTAKDDGYERAVHRPAHDVTEDRSRRADKRPGDDERRVLQGKTDAGRRPARVRVEHRDHHRHVGAADRDDDEKTDQEGEPGNKPECFDRLVGDEGGGAGHDDDADHEIEQVLAREHHRRAADDTLQFGKRHHRSGKGDRADGDTERHLNKACRLDVIRRADAVAFRRIERRRRDQHGGHADEAVKRRHQLRHRRHLNANRDERADHRADDQPGDDEVKAQDARVEKRRTDGDNHAGNGEPVAAPRRIRRRQAAQRHDETNAGDEVGEGGEID